MQWLPTDLNLLNTTARKLLATFCLFAMLNLALAWQALAYPMVFDDLHLIREFSTQEILSSFHHNYDTDGQENAGLRPFMVLYNHARYEMFHENVVAHRIFLVLLFALYITAVCWIARQFSLRWAWAVLAGVLLLGAKYSVNHYVWLTDGIHLFQGLLFCAAAISLIYAVRSRRWWLYALSAVFTLIGVLTREDTLATVPVLVVLGYVYARYTRQLRWPYLISYAACLGTVSAAFLVMRATFVPEAQHPALYVSGLFYHALLTPNFMGITSFDLLTQVLILG